MEPPHERIDAREPAAGLEHVAWHAVERRPAGLRSRWFDVGEDPIAERCLHLSPVVTPAEFRDKFGRIGRASDLRERCIADLRQSQHAVPDPRREPGDRPRHVIPGPFVGDGIDGSQTVFGGPSAAAVGRAPKLAGAWSCRWKRGSDCGEEFASWQAGKMGERRHGRSLRP